MHSHVECEMLARELQCLLSNIGMVYQRLNIFHKTENYSNWKYFFTGHGFKKVSWVHCTFGTTIMFRPPWQTVVSKGNCATFHSAAGHSLLLLFCLQCTDVKLPFLPQVICLVKCYCRAHSSYTCIASHWSFIPLTFGVHFQELTTDVGAPLRSQSLTAHYVGIT